MTDILSDALQKISEGSVDLVAGEHNSGAAAGVGASNEAREHLAVAQPAETATAPLQVAAALRWRPIHFLLQRRRQSIAVVILLCMAVLWLDESGTTSGETSSDSELTDAEEFGEDFSLSDFDAVQVSSMREPAEPLELNAAEQSPLTIPRMDDYSGELSTSADHTSHPLLNEPIGDRVAAPFSIPSDRPQSAEPRNENASGSAPQSVRFTGRIQPLN